jgi:hypothetical protein
MRYVAVVVVHVISLHPHAVIGHVYDELVATLAYGAGWVDTEGVRTSMPAFHKNLQSRLRSLAQGVDTVLWLALADVESLQPGSLYLDRAVQQAHMFMAGTQYRREDVDALWHELCSLAGLDDVEQADVPGGTSDT